LQPGEALSEARSKDLLRLYGIRTSRDELCTSAADAARAAKQIGFPVVLKVSSPDLLHKSDAGLVRVGVESPKEVRAAYDELLALGKKAGQKTGKKARIEGVLVCEMVTGGVEMLVGVSHDELFGPVLTVGTGGIFTEVFGDVTFRVPPFDAAEAQRALQELTGSKLLAGLRGAKPADVPALVDTIMRVQRLALELAGDVRELDINPLVVSPSSKRSRGAVALDALVVRA
jgi:acyl-CoA synthetase (NDP forming)